MAINKPIVLSQNSLFTLRISKVEFIITTMTIYKSITCFIVMLVMIACDNTIQKKEVHAHDDITVPYVAYSDSIEVFADVQPLAVGTNSKMIIHFTNVNTFKPLKLNAAQASLIIGNKGISVIGEKSKTHGIFTFIIQPTVAGMGRMEFELQINGQKQIVTLPKIEVYADAHNAVHLAEKLIPITPNSISFTKEQTWKVDFKTEVARYRPFGNIIKSTAKIENSPSSQKVVVSKSGGVVQITKDFLVKGREVKEREWLMTISSDGLTDNNSHIRLLNAQVEFDNAKADFTRYQKLRQQNITSERQFLGSKSRFEKAEATLKNLQSSVDLSGEQVRSDVNGYINEVMVDNGEFVEMGTSLFSVLQLDRLVLTALVSQRFANDLTNIYDVSIAIGENKVLSLAELNGEILAIGRSLDSKSFLVPVSIEIDNHTELIHGGFTNVYLKTTSDKYQVVVPETAIVEIQGLHFVYIQLTPELFERREVKIGATDGLNRAICSGLLPDERVVTRGSTLVKLAAVSNSIDPHAGHVH